MGEDEQEEEEDIQQGEDGGEQEEGEEEDVGEDGSVEDALLGRGEQQCETSRDVVGSDQRTVGVVAVDGLPGGFGVVNDFRGEEEQEALVVGVDEDVGEGEVGGDVGVQEDVGELADDGEGDDRFDVQDGEGEDAGVEEGREGHDGSIAVEEEEMEIGEVQGEGQVQE